MSRLCQIRTMMFLGTEIVRGYETSYFQVIDSEKRIRIAFVWDGTLDVDSITVSEAKEEFRRLAKGARADDWQEEIDSVV